MKFPKRDAAKKTIAKLSSTGGVDFDQATAEIWLEGDIGDAITNREVRSALKSIGSRKAKVYINSRGGVVTEGIAIFTALSEHSAGVDTYCTSLAASIASLLMQAGEKRYMYTGTMMMIHSPWANMSGNSAEFEKQIDILKKFEDQMTSVYVRRSGKSAAKIKQLLAVETWYTAQEAIDDGFADSIVGDSPNVKSMTLAEAKARLAKIDSEIKAVDIYPRRTAARSNAAKIRVAEILRQSL